MSSRFLRIFAFLTLLVGVATLYQAVKLYRAPTLLVEWSTASELDIAGFNVLRADQIDGPFTQVNTALIPPVGDSLNGGDYRFEDTNVQGGQTYYYQLQEVELSGATTLHGPIDVKAERAGVVEGILSGMLIAGSLFVLFSKPRL
ncbi:MAG TPA: hypothetical protein PK530_05935 [Anaerolineales bacterium]|nr:hypothetical protein [Anaerolineales bacterium]